MRPRWPSSKDAGCACDSGQRVTTTSAASASSVLGVLLPTRDGAASRQFFDRRRTGDDPADVSALGAAWVLANGAAVRRLRVDRSAFEATDTLECGQHRSSVRLAFHFVEDTALSGNLRGPTRPRAPRIPPRESSPRAKRPPRTPGNPAYRERGRRAEARTRRGRTGSAPRRASFGLVRPACSY